MFELEQLLLSILINSDGAKKNWIVGECENEEVEKGEEALRGFAGKKKMIF